MCLLVCSKDDSNQRREINIVQRTKTRISKISTNKKKRLNSFVLQMEEVKTKETYAVAKNLLEKYGGNITPDIRQRVSIKPNATPITNGNQTPVRVVPSTRLAGRRLILK